MAPTPGGEPPSGNPVYDRLGNISHYTDEQGNRLPPQQLAPEPTSLGVGAEEIRAMSVPELKDLAQRHGLPASGRKGDLYKTIEESFNADGTRRTTLDNSRYGDTYKQPFSIEGNRLPPEQGGAGGASAPPPNQPPPPPPGGGNVPPPQNPDPFAYSGKLTKTDVLNAAERIGVKVPRAVVGNKVEQGIAGGLSAIPYAGTPIVNAYERGVEQIGKAAARTVNELGSPGAEIAGEGAKGDILKWLGKTSGAELNDVYAGVNKMLRDGVTGELTATRKIVQQLQSEMAASTSTTAQPAIKMVEDAVTRPGGLSFQGLQALRTDVGARLDAAKVAPEPGTSIPALKRLYGGLSEDLRGVVRKAGGERAGQAYDQAETLAADIAKKRQSLQKIVGFKGEVGEEAVVKKLMQLASTNTADAGRLKLAQHVMGDEAWGNVSAEIGSRMGLDASTGVFSGDRFLTAYGKLSDAGKEALFGPAKQAFDDIALVASKFRELNKLGNPSGTGRVNAVMHLITSPIGAAAGVAGMLEPMSLVGSTAGFGLVYGGGRRLAWYLAAPATAGKAGGLIKAYYGVEKAFDKGARVLAVHEEVLQRSIKALALAAAKETGESAADIEARLTAQINQIRRK